MVLLIIIFVLIVLTVLGVAYLYYLFLKIRRSNRALLKQARGSNLEEILDSQNKYIKKQAQEIEHLQSFTRDLEKRLGFAIQKVKVNRYNAFPGEGGEQSFAVALLDQHQSGMVLSNIHGREGDRIYAKPLVAGKSRYHLMREEIEAIGKEQSILPQPEGQNKRKKKA